MDGDEDLVHMLRGLQSEEQAWNAKVRKARRRLARAGSVVLGTCTYRDEVAFKRATQRVQSYTDGIDGLSQLDPQLSLVADREPNHAASSALLEGREKFRDSCSMGPLPPLDVS